MPGILRTTVAVLLLSAIKTSHRRTIRGAVRRREVAQLPPYGVYRELYTYRYVLQRLLQISSCWSIRLSFFRLYRLQHFTCWWWTFHFFVTCWWASRLVFSNVGVTASKSKSQTLSQMTHLLSFPSNIVTADILFISSFLIVGYRVHACTAPSSTVNLQPGNTKQRHDESNTTTAAQQQQRWRRRRRDSGVLLLLLLLLLCCCCCCCCCCCDTAAAFSLLRVLIKTSSFSPATPSDVYCVSFSKGGLQLR